MMLSDSSFDLVSSTLHKSHFINLKKKNKKKNKKKTKKNKKPDWFGVINLSKSDTTAQRGRQHGGDMTVCYDRCHPFEWA